MIEYVTGLLMLFGGIVAVVQNYPRWNKYRIYGGALSILTVIYFFATRHVIAITPENVTLLILSRRALISAALLVWLVLGFRAYVLRK